MHESHVSTAGGIAEARINKSVYGLLKKGGNIIISFLSDYIPIVDQYKTH